MRVQELVGRRMREARERAGMSQEELGRALLPLLGREWTRQTVSGAEQGRRAFTAAEMVAIAYIVGGHPSSWLVLPADVDRLTLPGGAALSREDLRQSAAAASADTNERIRELLGEIERVGNASAGALVTLAARAKTLHDEVATPEDA